MRTSLVTFAPFEDDPARLLRLANAALIDRAGTSVDYVTAVCVVHRPADETLAWAIAGHPPPLRLLDGSPLDAGGAGQPLGLEVELDVASATAPLSDGDGVLLYTDGILDARDEASQRFGEERLRSLVAAHGRESATALVEHLRGGAGAVRAGGRRRRVPARGAESCASRLRGRPMKKVEPLIALELPAEPHSAKVARDAIAGLDGHLGSVFGDVVLLISELVTNSVRHAGLDASQPLQLSVATDGDKVRIAVRDPGPGFRPPKAPTDPGHVGGWGLVLVDQLAERVGRRARRRGERRVVRAEAAMSFSTSVERREGGGDRDDGGRPRHRHRGAGDGGSGARDGRLRACSSSTSASSPSSTRPACACCSRRIFTRGSRGCASGSCAGTGWSRACSRSRGSTSASRSSTTRMS